MSIDDRDLRSVRGPSSGSTAKYDAFALEIEHRILMIRGLSSVEAGNVVAYLAGLRPAASGWTVGEIDRLLALRAAVHSGVIGS